MNLNDTTVSYTIICKNLEQLNVEQLDRLKDKITKLIEDKTPYYNRKIPDYLLEWVFVYDRTKRYSWYDDVMYYAAKDGMMGKRIYSSRQIPDDATHIVEIHK